MHIFHFRRVVPSSSLRFLAVLAAFGGSAAACQSIHLDPDAGTTTGTGGSTSTTAGTGGTGGSTTTTTTTTGTGGSPAGECKSNADCAFPKAVCDVAAAKCVECAVHDDCSFEPGTVCSKGACVCPNLGADGKPDPDFQFCPDYGGLGDRCTNIKTSKDDCGECGHACFGACNNGKCADPWEPTAIVGAPEPRRDHVAVWDPTDHLMIVWGGSDGNKALDTGGVYDPKTRMWTKTSMVDAPSPRFNATAVWDDVNKNMIVWGGQNNGQALGNGALFDPKTNTWKPMPIDINTPSPRWNHTSAWTGTSMIVWGGFDGTSRLNTGAVFEPLLKGWTPLVSGAPAPAPRDGHIAIWRPGSSNMFVWGGFDGTNYLGDGALYAKDNGWSSLNPSPLGMPPTPRANHTAVWNGTDVLLWGGADGMTSFADGALNTSAAGDWVVIPPSNNVPEPRRRHTAVWLGNQMIVWGGESDPSAPHKLYDNGYGATVPAGMWTPLPVVPLAGRTRHTAVVAEAEKQMILWGGQTDAGVTKTGAVYQAP
ncbi:MAG: kelch repeat-containing protein [Byssovorax sp.]